MNLASFSNVFLWLQDYDIASVVFRRENHTLGLNSHHLPPLEVQDERTLSADELFRLVVLQKTCNCLSPFDSEVYNHSYEVS